MENYSNDDNQPYSGGIRWTITILLCVAAILLILLLFLYKGDEWTFFRGSSSTVTAEYVSSIETTLGTTAETTKAVPVYTQAPALTSEIALAADLTNDKIIYEQNADQITAPASLTKIVTALIALEKYGDILGSTYVTVPEEALRPFEGTIASVVPLKAGETVTMKDLLYCTLLPSACDAANVIAYYYGNGNPQIFIDQMNRYVESLGCQNTHFVNSHGLDSPEQTTTAKDMYLIAKAAINTQDFMEIAEHTSYTVSKNGPDDPSRVYSTIALMRSDSPYYFPYAKGIKTGSTSQAGRCLITTAEKDGQSFLIITMKAPYSSLDTETEKILAAQIDSLHLLQWAFSCAGITY